MLANGKIINATEKAPITGRMALIIKGPIKTISGKGMVPTTGQMGRNLWADGNKMPEPVKESFMERTAVLWPVGYGKLTN